MYVVADKTAEQLTGYRVHRGALASLHRKPLPEVPALAAAARRVIVLEDLVDHANVGAIFRSPPRSAWMPCFCRRDAPTRSTGVR